MRVSGIFRTDNIEGFVLLLESGFGIRAERSADAVRLVRAPGAAP
jgi:ferric-dicitrate binding protein FerR (iron transport regulator)